MRGNKNCDAKSKQTHWSEHSNDGDDVVHARVYMREPFSEIGLF